MTNYLNAKLLLFKKLLKKGSNIITNYELKEFSKIKKIAKEKKIKTKYYRAKKLYFRI
jgi:hypothetical protein